MYKIITTILLVIVSTAGTARSKIGIASSVDVKHIRIELNFDFEKRIAIGKTTINLTTILATKTILLDARKLDIASIHENHRAVNFEYYDDNTGVKVFLNRTLRPKEEISLTINYRTTHVNEYDPNSPGGSFGEGLRFFQSTQSNPIKRKQIWSQGESDGNAYWFPSINTMDDLRTTEFIATVEKPLTVISNGELQNVKENTNGTRTFHYKTEIPYPNYLTGFVVGEFTELVQRHGDIPFRTFCYPDEKVAATATTERLPDMVKFLSEKTGLNYPFKSYSQVMVQNYPFPSLTGQNTFSIISDNMIDDYGTHADFLYLWDGVEFNALASQWFGNAVSPAQWNDIWLTKGFAQYFEGLYTDHRNGHEEYLLWYHPFEIGSVFGDWNAGNRHPIVSPTNLNSKDLINDSHAKYRGALVLRMLRKELGDQVFFSSIRAFVKGFAFKPVSTKDFLNTVNTVSGKNMQWFFDQWIYTTGHPVFEITKLYDAKKKQLSLDVNQVQPADTIGGTGSTKYFKGKVFVEIDNRIEEIALDAKKENHFTFSAASQPQLVNFDFENTWIKEATFTKAFDELLYQFQNDKDVAGRQSAMLELVSIAGDASTTTEMKSKIHDAFFFVVNSSKLYWRMRSNAISQWRTILPQPYDQKTMALLTKIIKQEKSWLRAAAVGMLGNTNDKRFDDLYISLLNDTSDRVINTAAIALGKTKSPKAFDALMKLSNRPSWKQQSVMNALAGLAQLSDPRGAELAVKALSDISSPRWFLGNTWDYPLVAAQTLASLRMGDRAYPIVLERFQTALKENNPDDIFDHVLLLATLADPRAQQDVFAVLKEKYRDNENFMIAVINYEQQFQTSIKK